MVLKKEPVLKTVVDGLNILRAACEGRGKLGLTDLHVLAESFFCPFLNEAYGLNLKVLKTGHPAVDLGDATTGKSFQITADNSKTKIQDTLDTYSAKKLFSTYPSVKVLIIGTRRDTYALRLPKGVAFDQATDIVDVHTLGAEIAKMDTARIKRLAYIISEEILSADVFAKSARSSSTLEVSLLTLPGPPHAPNPYFVGRDDILRGLHHAFTEGEHPAIVQAMHGLGGMGKTQIAVEYAHRHREHYQATPWVRAEDPALLVADFARLALDLGLIRQPSADAAEDARRTLRELNGPAPRLVIMDNAPDEEAVREWIAASGNCRTLITSRFTSWSPAVRTIEVGVLEPAAARDFFLRRLGLPDSEINQRDADVLAKELGRLPLALEQAAAFMKEMSVSFDRTLEYFMEARSRRDLLARRVLGSTQYPESVAATWLTTMQRLEPLAKAVLDFASFLASDAIPRDLLWNARSLMRQGLVQSAEPANREDTEITDFALDKALGQLHRYSMIRLGAEAFSIHRLLQAVVRDGMDESRQRAWAARAILTVNQSFPEIEFKNWGSCERLLPHAKITTALVAKWSFVFPEAAHLLNKTGHYLSERGNYTAAEPLLRQAVEVFLKAVGEDHPDFASSLNNLGLLYIDQGNFAAAEPLLRQAVGIYEKLPGEPRPPYAISLNNLALIYLPQGTPAVERLCRLALEVSRKAVGERHAYFAMSLNNLGGLYREQDNYTAAEPLLRQAVEICEKLPDQPHPYFAAALSNLALLYHYQGNFAAAEPRYCQALEVKRQALGENHPDLAIGLENYARLLRETNRLEEAMRLEEQANTIRRRPTDQPRE